MAFLYADAKETPRSVSLEQATALVVAALPTKTKQLPEFGIEQFGEDQHSQFYFLTAYWQGAPNGSMIIGNYAVDPSTGDVWDAVMECSELNTRALRKLQKRIRREIGLSDSEYKKIKSKGLLCQ